MTRRVRIRVHSHWPGHGILTRSSVVELPAGLAAEFVEASRAEYVGNDVPLLTADLMFAWYADSPENPQMLDRTIRELTTAREEVVAQLEEMASRHRERRASIDRGRRAATTDKDKQFQLEQYRRAEESQQMQESEPLGRTVRYIDGTLAALKLAQSRLVTSDAVNTA